MKMVESIPQVWEVVVGLLLKVNKLYYRQLILLDPAYYILRVFVSEHNFSNSVVKKVLFGLSSCRAKEELFRVLLNLPISF